MRIVGENVTFSIIASLTNTVLSAKEAHFMNGITTGSLAVLIATLWPSELPKFVLQWSKKSTACLNCR